MSRVIHRREKEKPSAVYKKVSREPDRYRAEHSFIGSKVPSKVRVVICSDACGEFCLFQHMYAQRIGRFSTSLQIIIWVNEFREIMLRCHVVALS